MESSAQSNLEADIKTWRSQLSDRGPMAKGDIDELENHLRETIADLSTERISTTEAFMVAKHRLGGTADLKSEFRKVYPGRLWSMRVCWMLIGYLSFTLIGDLASFLSQVTMAASVSAGVQSGLANFVGVSILGGTWFLFIRFLVKRCRSVEAEGPLPFSAFLYRRPVASAVLVLTLYLAIHFSSQMTSAYFVRVLANGSGGALPSYLLTQAFSNLGLTCLLLAGATLSIQRLRRVSG